MPCHSALRCCDKDVLQFSLRTMMTIWLLVWNEYTVFCYSYEAMHSSVTWWLYFLACWVGNFLACILVTIIAWNEYVISAGDSQLQYRFPGKSSQSTVYFFSLTFIIVIIIIVVGTVKQNWKTERLLGEFQSEFIVYILWEGGWNEMQLWHAFHPVLNSTVILSGERTIAESHRRQWHSDLFHWLCVSSW